MVDKDREDYAYGANVWRVTWQAMAVLARFVARPFKALATRGNK